MLTCLEAHYTGPFQLIRNIVLRPELIILIQFKHYVEGGPLADIALSLYIFKEAVLLITFHPWDLGKERNHLLEEIVRDQVYGVSSAYMCVIFPVRYLDGVVNMIAHADAFHREAPGVFFRWILPHDTIVVSHIFGRRAPDEFVVNSSENDLTLACVHVVLTLFHYKLKREHFMSYNSLVIELVDEGLV
jgi:hypothetical protein